MILSCSNITKSFGDNDILKHISFHIEEHEKAAVVGINGAGKSTLLKIMIGELAPDEGSVTVSKGSTIGYLAQHQDLEGAETIYDALLEVKRPILEMEEQLRRLELEMKSASGDELEAKLAQYGRLNHEFEMANGYACRSEITGVLKGLGFEEDEFTKPITALSGGQKTRVSLGKLLLTKPDILLLDEPTNHLDMDSREVLEAALEDYPGTILAISHDRYFINRFATRVMVLEQGGVKEYLGNYDDYLEKINRGQAPDGDQPQTTKTAQDKEKRRSREATQRLKALKAAVSEAEAAVAKAEQEQADLEALMAAPETYQDAAKAAELAKRYQQVQQEVARRYEVWEAAEAALAAEE